MLYFYIVAITQIVLESFPVSSSGHLKLLEKIFAKNLFHSQYFFGSYSEFASLANLYPFYQFLHGATIVVLALFFFNRWFFMLKNIRRCFFMIVRTAALTLCADLITVFFALLFSVISFDLIAHYFSCNVYTLLTFGFIITAAVLVSLIVCKPGLKRTWDFRMACMLGVAQGFALFPGISRMAITYCTGRWLALTPRKSFEISCLIEFPLIVGGFLLTIFFHGHTISQQFLNPMMLFVMLAASCIAYGGLWFVSRIAESNRMQWFALYMIVPIILSLL